MLTKDQKEWIISKDNFTKLFWILVGPSSTYADEDDEDEDEKPPVPKRTTSRTASAQQILQAIKQQQKSTTLTSITATSTTLPSGITSSTANIEHKKIVDTTTSQQPSVSQSKQNVGFYQQTSEFGILNSSGKYSGYL